MKKRVFLPLILLLSVVCSCMFSTSCHSGEEQRQTTEEVKSQSENDHSEVAEGDLVVYEFRSMQDMHTYITTGSTDSDDYQYPGGILFNQTAAERAREYGYRPLWQYFDIDPEQYERNVCGFSFDADRPRILHTVYCMDEIGVSLIAASQYYREGLPCLFDYYVAFYGDEVLRPTETESDMVLFSNRKEVENGYIRREYGDSYVLYRITDGKFVSFAYVVDGALLTIRQIHLTTDMTHRDLGEITT
ncbi:MAG: hypothetical protein J6125_02735, partial [Clostridia bacterium]|nr:hypothetical protein [Clostridia bacterium]